jgi:succinyl-CoA synthetase beta subunit
VKAILVNIFGGIVDCAIISSGIVKAARDIDLKVPIVARLEGKSSDDDISFTKSFRHVDLCKELPDNITASFIPLTLHLSFNLPITYQ